MTRFIIFVTLLSVQFARGISETIVHANEGSSIALRTFDTYNLEYCIIRTNKGEEFKYESGYKDITDKIRSTSFFDSCTVTVENIQEEDLGEWMITAYLSNKDTPRKEFKYLVYITANHDMIPANEIQVREGLYVSAKMDVELPDVQSCKITSPKGETVDLLSEKVKGMELYGSCGFRLTTKYEHRGKWMFNALVNDRVLHTSSLYLNVDKELEETSQQKVIELVRGKEGHIDLGTSGSFCQLEDPKGVMLPLIRGPCHYTVPLVTIYHEGVWIARYGVTGKLSLEVQRFTVTTREPTVLESNVTVSENGEIKLLCHVQVKEFERFDFCRFTRPDGTVLNISPGISTNRYSAYRESNKNSPHELTCGLIVRKPENSDYGTWKCDISAKGSDHAGTLLRVERKRKGSDTNHLIAADTAPARINAVEVYVKRGNSFTVKCNADAALNYCWFRSPNGTAYSVSYSHTPNRVNFTLPYEGSGLSLGECGVRIDNAVRSDHGKWTCNLGVVNSTEERLEVPVIVTESYVIAEDSDIVAGTGNNLVLSCNLLPRTVDRAVHYCRWIRPDGFGIYNGVSHRYTATNSKSQCRLVILNYRKSEDAGRWTCVAGTVGPTDEEAWATINVGKQTIVVRSALVGLLVAASILLCVTVGAFIFINVMKRRRALPKEPPAYSTQQTNPPPKSLNPNYFSKEFQY